MNTDLVQADQDILAVLNYDDDPLAYGVDLDQLTVSKRALWNRQDAFLRIVARTGSVAEACRKSNTHHASLQYWQDKDSFSFPARLENALQCHAGWIETTITNRIANPEGNRGSDNLLIAAANANTRLPNWSYRSNGTSNDGDSASKGMLAELSSMGKRRAKVTHTETTVEVEG